MKQAQQLALNISKPNSQEIFLRLKAYIQPFERYLAKAELEGLLKENIHKNAFLQKAESEVRIVGLTDANVLEERLAYWERIGSWELRPLFQVLLESGKKKGTIDIYNFHYHHNRRLRYGPHGIHEYRGKFFPQLVKSLVNFAGLSKNDIVLDPMCGSGTTNCEARSMGMRTLGIDLNPLSVLVSRTKTALLDANRESFENEIRQTIKLVDNADINGETLPEINVEQKEVAYLERWFSRQAIKEIWDIISLIKKCSDSLARDFMLVCLSNIIKSVSWQKESDLRVRKEVRPYEAGTSRLLFVQEVNNSLNKALTYLSWFEFSTSPEFKIVEGDSRQVNSILSDYVGKCDLLITSPPYAMALPYIDTDRLSLALLGILPHSQQRMLERKMIGNREISEKERRELWEDYEQKCQLLPPTVNATIQRLAGSNHQDGVGFRRRNLPALLSKYFLDMAETMRNSRKMMKPGSCAFYVVGNNSTKVNGERVTIETDRLLWETGKSVGWKQKRIIGMELLPSRDIFRYQRGTSESILWFEA